METTKRTPMAPVSLKGHSVEPPQSEAGHVTPESGEGAWGSLVTDAAQRLRAEEDSEAGARSWNPSPAGQEPRAAAEEDAEEKDPFQEATSRMQARKKQSGREERREPGTQALEEATEGARRERRVRTEEG
ncbi:hypothetical protein NDU88_006219 [Pleurodeles waltl]|uniref:Uncharacterized protein n=1 Tax=Pleurodeles waltl TaxID=8319 RepID=A0AAV7QKS5_PLEWA|nr:hypothetical protein NDU88_006219 [Pleurodeles waltl]